MLVNILNNIIGIINYDYAYFEVVVGGKHEYQVGLIVGVKCV